MEVSRGNVIILPEPIIDKFKTTVGPVANTLWLRRKQACTLTTDQYFMELSGPISLRSVSLWIFGTEDPYAHTQASFDADRPLTCIMGMKCHQTSTVTIVLKTIFQSFAKIIDVRFFNLPLRASPDGGHC
jgi:hypothetical protein